MRIVLYVIWFGIPALLFVLSFWAKLEQLGKSHRKQNPGDFFRQGIFMLAVALVCFAIDYYWLEDLVDNFAPEVTPLLFYEIIIYPLVAVLGAQIVGGSKPILIGEAPRPSTRGKKP